MYSKFVIDGHIHAVSNANNSHGTEISEAEYNEIMNAMRVELPDAPSGKRWELRDNDLVYETVDVPAPVYSDKPTAEDYEEALGRFGV